MDYFKSIKITVGFMLKVLKNGGDTLRFKREFAEIRHGNYHNFIKIIKGPISPLVVSRNGNVEIQKESREDDFDFLGLLYADKSLLKFYIECRSVYGDLIDPDIDDFTYEQLAYFEIILRMTAKNVDLLAPRDSLFNVIEKLCQHRNIGEIDKEKLHQGRKFLNQIKHLHDNKGKSKFSSITEGITAFKETYSILKNHNIK
jgi:hypothetical protein